MNSDLIIFGLLIAATLLIAWAVFDRVVYSGPGSVTPNDMLHASPTHKTVFVVPHKELKKGSNILVAVVSNAKAAQIASAGFSERHIVVRRRLFGSLRVTRIG
jgi:hypothetical protein